MNFSSDRRMQGWLLECGILEKWHSVTWEQYDNDPETKEKIESYYEKAEEARKDGVGLYMWGENGIGKTHAAMCLLKALTVQDRYVVRAISFGTMCDLFTAGWRDPLKAELFKKIYQVPDFLLVEEPAKEYKSGDNDIGRTVLDTFVRYRIQSKKPTIFTSNTSAKGITGVYTHDIGSMLFEGVIVIKAMGVDRRPDINQQLKGKYGI